MLLVFSLLTISLLWSAGQRLDAWAFLFINLRGPRPLWLDRVMLGFTQIGNGITGLAIALIFFGGRRPSAGIRDRAGYLDVMAGGRVDESPAAPQTAFYPADAGTRRWPSGRRAILPERPHEPGLFHGDTAGPTFPCRAYGQHLLCTALLCCWALPACTVGAHYPRDVLAGAILGSAWGLLGAIVDPYVLIRLG